MAKEGGMRGNDERRRVEKSRDLHRLTETDIYLFKEGNHFRLYEKLGARPLAVDGVSGTAFAVWAPNAVALSVVGDFNGWDPAASPLKPREDESGIWEGWIAGVEKGAVYKYHLRSRIGRFEVDKGDPFAFAWEAPPKTASVVWNLDYDWEDSAWMEKRRAANRLEAPMSIYEVHLGSWRRSPEEGNRSLTYREAAPLLADYVCEMGFTHVELLPVMAHPFYGSWGYQTVGYFAPTPRGGDPQDLMCLIDTLHRRGIGVILDWVPSHFPSDEHGLIYFDGTHLYEHADPRLRIQPDWNSNLFNYGRNEVRAFLISNALFWLEKYHADGLRVDAVASMLYLDYSRKEGEWIPNRYGGRENLEAISFLKRMNEAVYEAYPDVQTFAEESTAWPMVSRPTDVGGLGFGMKWNMGWMHDTLSYFSKDPIYRKYHHDRLTFGALYAFSENFLLPLSHDEVVHGKGSLLEKMPGDPWQKFAHLRLLFGYQFGHPGKKLLFMGGEFGQWREWNHEASLDWPLLDQPAHQGIRRWVRDLNTFYRGEPALHEWDFNANGFEWIDCADSPQSVVSFLRRGPDPDARLLFVFNFTPTPRRNYRLGVPGEGVWEERLNGDASLYGGSGMGNLGEVRADPVSDHGRPFSITITLPPLAMLLFRKKGEGSRSPSKHFP